MNKKLYYNHPLISAYMAREFCVRYINNIKGFRCDVLSEGKETPHFFEVCKADICDKYYIHPDSYHIFEPKDGDVLQDRKGECLIYSTHQNLDLKYFKIIQRNNRPFFWPESEKE